MRREKRSEQAESWATRHLLVFSDGSPCYPVHSPDCGKDIHGRGILGYTYKGLAILGSVV